MTCSLGRRTRDDAHPVCQSCQRHSIQCGSRHPSPKSSKARTVTTVETRSDGPVLVVRGLPLKTLNDYLGDRYAYGDHRRAWGSALAGAAGTFPAQPGVALLRVRRIVARKQGFIRDETNLQASLKPLEDALVSAGALVDDSITLLRREIVQLTDKRDPRVEIEVKHGK